MVDNQNQVISQTARNQNTSSGVHTIKVGSKTITRTEAITIADVKAIARENGIGEFKVYTTDRNGSDGGPAPMKSTEFPFQGNEIIIRSYDAPKVV